MDYDSNMKSTGIGIVMNVSVGMSNANQPVLKLIQQHHNRHSRKLVASVRLCMVLDSLNTATEGAQKFNRFRGLPLVSRLRDP